MDVCENCGSTATMYRVTPRGDVPTCDAHVPGDWTGEVRPLIEALPDLTGRRTLSKSEAAASLGMSQDHFERHVVPDLRVITRGRRVLVPVDALDAWVAASAARALKD